MTATAIEDELDECGHVHCAADMAVWHVLNKLAGLTKDADTSNWLISLMAVDQ
jgi:hypothetical protein